MSAYLDGLRMLARRELSEAQVRQRLARRGHDSSAVDEAVARLREERAIDDTRVAGVIARTQAAVKGRGRLRTVRQIEQAGIARAVAQRAADEAFASIDAESHITAAIEKRLRGRATIADRTELARLYRYLVAQGFDPDEAMRALGKRR